MTDATYQDGDDRPLRLLAQDATDLQVIAALVQDSVLTGADLTWQPKKRRFALLLNRFRWEDAGAAGAARRPAERVRSLLTIGDVTHVAQQGLDRDQRDTVLSLLTLSYAADSPPEDPAGPAGPGRVTLILAGDGAVALTVECLDVTLSDVTRPYAALARSTPHHQT